MKALIFNQEIKICQRFHDILVENFNNAFDDIKLFSESLPKEETIINIKPDLLISHIHNGGLDLIKDLTNDLKSKMNIFIIITHHYNLDSRIMDIIKINDDVFFKDIGYKADKFFKLPIVEKLFIGIIKNAFPNY